MCFNAISLCVVVVNPCANFLVFNEQIFKEEVFDLLDPNSAVFSKAEGVNSAKPAVPARVPIQIRETVNGGIMLAGVTEAEVRNKEEMSSYLSRGSLCRATGSTNMNSQSRCGFHHAIAITYLFHCSVIRLVSKSLWFQTVDE